MNCFPRLTIVVATLVYFALGGPAFADRDAFSRSTLPPPETYAASQRTDTYQLKPQHAGELLYLDKQFAIHENHHMVLSGRPVCDRDPIEFRKVPNEKPTYLYLVTILNAGPEYKVTKEWLWNSYRPKLKAIVDKRCRGASGVFVSFYIRGVDVKARAERMAHNTVWWYTAYQIDDEDFPEVVAEPCSTCIHKLRRTYKRGTDGKLYSFPTTNLVSYGFVRAVFDLKENMSGEYLARFQKRLNGRTLFEAFEPSYFGGDGSFIGYYNHQVEENIQTYNLEKARRAQHIFNTQMVLGFAAAWQCGQDYQEWCDDIMPAIGSIGPKR